MPKSYGAVVLLYWTWRRGECHSCVSSIRGFGVMSDELCFLPATELRARVMRKDVSPVEIMRAVLARAERLQPTLNCFITLCGDEAMAEAGKAERAVTAGERLGLLHGIPFTVKD